MSIFGFGTPAELQTPIGIGIKAATDSLRLTPDWSKNIEICDEINRKRDAPEQAAKAIKRRLQDSDQQTVYLSLVLLESFMKNCGTSFAAFFDRSLMDEVVSISKGSKGPKNSDEALRLIQQWARAYEKNKSFSLFSETFLSLKSRGVVFPKEEHVLETENSGTTNQAPRRSISTSKPSTDVTDPISEPPQPNENESEKVRSDLAVVVEKVKLCREMLQVSPGVQLDEALADVVGFLEACRDRLVDLVEAGAQGTLGEELFEYVLKVNDAVYKTLEAERNGVKIEVDEGFSEQISRKSNNNLLDFDTPTDQPKQHKEDLFGLMDTHLAPSKTPVKDPFESVFGATTNVTSQPTSNIANPSDDIPHDVSSLPVPPSTNANVHTPDEFDLLFNATPSKPPVTSTANSIPNTEKPKAPDDFDEFFASLK